MDLAVHARLEALERRVEQLSRPTLSPVRTGYELPSELDRILRAQVYAGDRSDAATIEIFGVIDEALRRDVEQRLWATRGARSLTIRIDSDGGDFWRSMAIYRAIRWHPAERKTAIMGRTCSSGALVVAMACDRRVAGPGTHVVMHLTGTMIDGSHRWTAAERAQAARDQSAMDCLMVSLLAERSSADFDALVAEASDERPSSMEWLISAGIVHAVEEAPAA